MPQAPHCAPLAALATALQDPHSLVPLPRTSPPTAATPRSHGATASPHPCTGRLPGLPTAAHSLHPCFFGDLLPLLSCLLACGVTAGGSAVPRQALGSLHPPPSTWVGSAQHLPFLFHLLPSPILPAAPVPTDLGAGPPPGILEQHPPQGPGLPRHDARKRAQLNEPRRACTCPYVSAIKVF